MDDATADPHNSLLPGAAEKPSLLLFCFVFIVELLPFMFGYSIGFTSPTFVGDCAGGANAQAMNCELLLSSEQSSLFGSVINMGALIGALTGSFVIDPLGRKAGMLTSSALFAVSWACIAAAPVPKAGATEASAALLVLLFVGRALSGVAIGFTCCVVNIYVSEVSTVSLRGALGTLFQVSIVLGLVITYLLGLFLTWREMAIIIAVMGAIVTVLLTFIPESPVWSWQRYADRVGGHSDGQPTCEREEVGGWTGKWEILCGRGGGHCRPCRVEGLGGVQMLIQERSHQWNDRRLSGLQQ